MTKLMGLLALIAMTAVGCKTDHGTRTTTTQIWPDGSKTITETENANKKDVGPFRWVNGAFSGILSGVSITVVQGQGGYGGGYCPQPRYVQQRPMCLVWVRDRCGRWIQVPR